MPRIKIHRHQHGMTTCEYAVGVVAAAAIAALLLALVLDGFFDELLGSLFERVLDAVRSMFSAGAAVWSLSEIATRAWSTLTAAAASSGSWTLDAVPAAAGHTISAVSTLATSTWSGLSAVASTVLDATAGALRWVGGPVSEVVR